MRHEGIKNHICTICGLRTVTASALRIHVNSHTKDNLWPCEFCDFKSTTQGEYEFTDFILFVNFLFWKYLVLKVSETEGF